MKHTIDKYLQLSDYRSGSQPVRLRHALQWLVILFIGLFAGLLVPVTAMAAITATLDRNEIVQGETVTLVIQTNDPQQNLDPNLDALQEDFILLDRRSETQMSIVNGRQSAVMRLLLTLEPKRTGALQIPPLQLGDEQTQALQLKVDAAPEIPEGEMPPVFIELEIDPQDGPYFVHAQMRLTVRVFYLANLTEAAITPPEPANASVRLLDEVPFQAERGDVRYRVLERHYALFPERSGPLVIPAMSLTGRLVERRSDRLWQPSVRGRRIEASSDLVELEILPRPASFTGDNWLPARQLEATQNISASDAPVVGEPITRTVIIDAVGLEENMLTEPVWPEIAGARIYPDQPQGITRDDGRWVLGHKEFRYAVVPEEAGELVLPELTLEWWDTLNNRQQRVVLPEKRMAIAPSALQLEQAAAAAAGPAEDQISGPVRVTEGPVTGGYWRWTTGLFAALWLLTLLLYWRKRNAAEPLQTARQSASEAETDLLKEFKRACEQSDAGQARKALARWLKRYGPGDQKGSLGGSLVDFARRVDDEELGVDLAVKVRELDAAGFQPGESAEWNATGLVAAFDQWRQRREQQQEQPSVTDLYARR